MRSLSRVFLTAAIAASAAAPARASAQLSGNGCFVGAYQTCAIWSLVNTTGSWWQFNITNTSTVPVQKFGELYVFFPTSGAVVDSVTSTPAGWLYGGVQSPSSSLWYSGTLGVMGDNVQFVRGPDILIGQSAQLRFKLTGATPIGVGVHTQPSDTTGYDSQRIRFGDPVTVPEPSSYGLVAAGLAMVAAIRRRRVRA